MESNKITPSSMSFEYSYAQFWEEEIGSYETSLPNPYSSLPNILSTDDSSEEIWMDELGKTHINQTGTSRIYDLKNIINFLIDELVSFSQENSVQIHCGDMPSLFIRMDNDKIHQALKHIIKNAILYNKANGTVVIKIQELDEKVEIIVEDSGKGMDKDALDNIYNIHTKSTSQGKLCMGMHLCKEWIDEQKGSLSVESEIGVGTKVKILLPLTI